MKETGRYETEWGFELLWANNDKFSGKIIVFPEVGNKMPMHVHKEKTKSWFINAGKFKITYVDASTKEVKEAFLDEGRTCSLAAWSAHEVEALEPNSMIFEVATTETDGDFHYVNVTTEGTPPSGQ